MISATSEGIFLVLSPLPEHVKDEVPPADDADKFALGCYGYSSKITGLETMADIGKFIFGIVRDAYCVG